MGKKTYLGSKLKNPKKVDSWALTIKLADRLDNVADLKDRTKEFRKRYTEETKFLIKSLEKERKLSQTQKVLIKEIKEKLKWQLKN